MTNLTMMVVGNVSETSPGIHPDVLQIIANVKLAKKIIQPIMVFFGITGNLLTLVVFTRTVMKQFSCSFLLSSLAIVDNIFLVNVLIAWLDVTFDTNIANTIVLCQLTVYSQYLASFVSVWIVVTMTAERYVAICHPLYATRLCTRKREKILLSVLILGSCVLYSYSLWTSVLVQSYGGTFCNTLQEYLELLTAMAWVDIITTVILPLVLLFIFNLKIVLTLCAGARSREAEYLRTSQYTGRGKSRNQISIVQRKYTATLLLVSISFFFLVLPSHVFRLFSVVFGFPESMPGILKHVMYESFQLIYHLTFAINIFIYTFSGKLFRKHLLGVLTFSVNSSRNHSSVSVNTTVV